MPGAESGPPAGSDQLRQAWHQRDTANNRLITLAGRHAVTEFRLTTAEKNKKPAAPGSARIPPGDYSNVPANMPGS
jgi:hypothetical protein